MKKIILYVCLLCMLLIGCNNSQKDVEVKNGTYYMETGSNVSMAPYIQISGKQMVFTYDFLSSYLIIGDYTIEDDTLTMTTTDGEKSFVFQIDGNSLLFQKNESSAITFIDEKIGIEIEDGAKFSLE